MISDFIWDHKSNEMIKSAIPLTDGVLKRRSINVEQQNNGLKTRIKILQLNAMRSLIVMQEIQRAADERKTEIICLQEPNTRNGSPPHMPVTSINIICGERTMAATIILTIGIVAPTITLHRDNYTICLEI